MSTIQTTPKGYLYQHLTYNFSLASYLCKPIKLMYKKTLARFRLSSHNLNIEQGRYRNIHRDQRICESCNLNDIEDEFHFILKCTLYNDFRRELIKPYYFKRPNVFKLIQLLTTENMKELNKLGKFLFLSMKRRNATV